MGIENLPVLLVALLAHPTACENEQTVFTHTGNWSRLFGLSRATLYREHINVMGEPWSLEPVPQIRLDSQ